MRTLLYYLFVGIALIATLGSCSERNSVDSIIQQYKNGEISEDSLLSYLSDSINYKASLKWANSHKEDGMAFFILGRAYYSGLGTTKNLILSKANYVKAIELGSIRSMHNLAVIYCDPGCEDLDSAYYWFSEAAKNGLADSYFGVATTGALIRHNKNLPIDTIQFINYIKQGYSKGSMLCATELAKSYLSGFGVEKNSKKAYQLLIALPDEKLDAEALFVLGQMFENGNGVPQNFNKSTKYFKRSSDKGNTNATCQLGVCYQMGQGVEQNDSLAFMYYKKAANEGNAWGQRNVSTCYIEGIGTEINLSKGFEWVKMAAKNGDEVAIEYCNKNRLNYKE